MLNRNYLDGEMIESNFLRHSKTGRYAEAKALLYTRSENELYDFLLDLSVEEESVAVYTFVCFLLSDNENAQLHHYSSAIISAALVSVEGAYSAGLFYARKAVELEPDNIKHKEWMLFFYGILDKIMSDEEAFSIVQEILRVEPTNKIALEALEDIKWLQSKNKRIQS